NTADDRSSISATSTNRSSMRPGIADGSAAATIARTIASAFSTPAPVKPSAVDVQPPSVPLVAREDPLNGPQDDIQHGSSTSVAHAASIGRGMRVDLGKDDIQTSADQATTVRDMPAIAASIGRQLSTFDVAPNDRSGSSTEAQTQAPSSPERLASDRL